MGWVELGQGRGLAPTLGLTQLGLESQLWTKVFTSLSFTFLYGKSGEKHSN
jgi:hypothetical protein